MSGLLVLRMIGSKSYQLLIEVPFSPDVVSTFKGSGHMPFIAYQLIVE